MTRLSSDWTLFYKFFLPTVWVVFFAVVLGFLLFAFRPPFIYQVGALVLYLGGIGFLFITLFQFKRVEADVDRLYITNYFKTFRYTFQSIKKITRLDMIIFKVITLHLNESGSFGKKVRFIRRKTVWEEYLFAHKELAALLES